MMKTKLVIAGICFITLFFPTSVLLAEKEASLLTKTRLESDAMYMARQGRFDEALQLVREALRENEGSPMLISDYIVILSWSGRYKEALAQYEALPEDFHFFDYVLPEVAKCYRFLGQYGKAIAVYNRYLSEQMSDRVAIGDLVWTYLIADQPRDARLYMKKLLQERPKDTWLEVYLADILVYENKLDEAKTIYVKEIARNPYNTYARLGLSRVLLKQQDYKGAERIVNDILKDNPRDIEALFRKGEILESQREFLAAYQLYNKILLFYPSSSNARNLKYRALMQLGSNSLVKDLLKQRGETIDPELEQVILGNQGMEYIRWQEPKEALDILKKQNATYLTKDEHPAGIVGLKYPERVLMRNVYDQILSLNVSLEMKEVVSRYEELKSRNVEVPPWIIVAAALEGLDINSRFIYDIFIESE